SDTDELLRWRDRILARARENPRLVNADSDLRETKPLLRVTVNRERAADLGVSVAAVGQTLETMLGSRRVTTFVDRGEEYDVILQAEAEDRASVDDLTNIFVRADSGALVSLANLVDVRETAGPTQLNRFNRLRSVTISAALAEDYPLGEALAWLESIAREELPPTARIDYRGQSRELREASSDIYLTFALALVVVFLVLAAQFESFVHPAVILLTVPLAVAGALAGLWLIGSSLNIYSQIGIVILIGLASKNGILIVEFANQLRDEGKEFMEAIVEASAIRFRPIVMTSLSTAFGALPLVVATGAGAASRETIGIVIFAGVIGATVLTLFIVPAAYAVIARRTKSPGAIAAEMAAWEARENSGAAQNAEMR
ncbi:MAG TPA: efflux RND transporter permease subunit, partial [Micropepsaceae bacterium]|nr:efflux RND transporter permease subunit [Micropepsaceae bacterium]